MVPQSGAVAIRDVSSLGDLGVGIGFVVSVGVPEREEEIERRYWTFC